MKYGRKYTAKEPIPFSPLILSEIDKAALTAEQILMATKYISDVDSIDIIDARLSAAAQLEAIKKQLRGEGK